MNARGLSLIIVFLLALGCGDSDAPGGNNGLTGLTFATLAVTTTSLPNAAPTVAYGVTLVATGGDGSYTWSVTGGSLPTGLSLNTSTGAISGTPTGSGSTFTVQVTSGDGQTATRQLTITLNAVLAVTTTTLPNGVLAVAYSETLTATGGDGSYTWSVTVGSLPMGLSLNMSTGAISGTPAVAETQNFTVQAASGDGQTAQQALSITVNAVSGGLTFQSVSAGTFQSCGVTTVGAAYCWGFNDFGQLGNGTLTNSNVPALVSGGFSFQSVSAGLRDSCGVTTPGAAYCWGLNTDGRLGDGTLKDSDIPVAVTGGLAFQSVSAGQSHTCGVAKLEAAYCWGLNTDGRLGDGTNTNSLVPVAVLGGLTFQSVTGGGAHSCGLTTTGAAYCWGRGASGQLGDGTLTNSNVPVAVSGALKFQSVSVGKSHTCGVATGGVGYCWGFNSNGELGDGNPGTLALQPVVVSGGLTFRSVSAGGAGSCGVTTVGAAYCWGFNAAGQLGDGTLTNSNVPVAVSGGLTFQSVSVGAATSHTCGVATSGAAYCWGSNGSGQLGDGTNTSSNVPVRVAGS